MKPIPLESDFNWWWYRSKSNILNYFLLQSDIKSNLRILEIGPGLGNNLPLLNYYGSVDILETENEFINYLNLNKKQFFNSVYKSLDENSSKYDLIVMLDVLEHIKESETFMNNLNNFLNEDGFIILGVPAYQALWSTHDEKLQHYRRYSWKKIHKECSLYNITEKIGLNYLLLPIRYLQVKLNKIPTTNESGKLVNELLYIVSLFEGLIRKIGIKPKFGISLYAKLEKVPVLKDY